MTPFQKKMLRAGVNIEAVTRRAWDGLGRLFLSKEASARRISGRFEALKRQEQEEERLDRLRNPRDYQGK
jgi:hypothetical protein